MTAPPETDTLLLIVMVTVPEPVAAFDMTKVVALVTETTVVLAGMFVPVMVCPAPINDVEATVTVVDVLTTVADNVKTPTCDWVVPEDGPNKTGVLTVLSIAVRFCPGCAIRFDTPLPEASNTASNCHKLFALAVKLDSVKSTIPAPTPFWSTVRVCTPSE